MRVLVIVIAMYALMGELEAQWLAQPGEPVRVTSGVYQQLVSTVQAISAESLTVRALETEIHLAMAQVSLLEIYVGQKSYAVAGAIVGVLGGIGIGGAVGNAAATCEASGNSYLDCFEENIGAFFLGAAIGGVVLGVTGWLIGGSI